MKPGGKMITRKFVWLLLMVLLLAACTPASPVGQPTTSPSPTPAYPAPYDAPIQPPAPALIVQQALADELGVSLDQVVISVVEEVEWTDGCLGLGGPEESCLQAIVPGYRIQLSVDGKAYEYRTDLTGEVWRKVGEPDDRRLSEKAAELLAMIAGLKWEEIHFQGLKEVEWPSACLGAEEPDEMCAEVVTPGYRVELEHDGRVYIMHTNAEMTIGRLGGPVELVVALKVRQVAAQEMNTALETVRLIESRAVEWSDSCLGIDKAGVACLAVITPGYRVEVEVGRLNLEYHTNREASAIVRKE
jgi:hypothetical protein